MEVLYDTQAAMTVAKQLKYCQRGDSVVAVHRIGHSAVIKISDRETMIASKR